MSVSGSIPEGVADVMNPPTIGSVMVLSAVASTTLVWGDATRSGGITGQAAASAPMTMTTNQFLTISTRMDEDELIACFGSTVFAFPTSKVVLSGDDFVETYDIVADPPEYDPCLFTVTKTKAFLGIACLQEPPQGWHGVVTEEQRTLMAAFGF